MNFTIKSTKIKFIYFLVFTTIVTISFLLVERHVRINYPNNTFSMYKGITYYNIDNEYYLSPVENYLAGKGWRRNPPVGDGSYFRRTPGYSLFYLFARTITTDIDSSFKLIVLLQFILYLFFFYAFSKILILLDISPFLYNISMAIMSVIPYFYHIIPATNTESISVFLILFFVYFVIAGHKNSNSKNKLICYILASFFVGYATLTRPYLGMFLVILPMLVYSEYYKSGIKTYFLNNILIGFIPVFMIAVWTMRNYKISNEIVFLEQAYHPESLDRMKPEFRGFFKLAMSCGQDGPTFNSYQMPLFLGALNGDTSFQYVQNCLNSFSNKQLASYGKENISSLIRKYQLLVYDQKQYYDKQIPMPKQYSENQLSLERDFNQIINKYKKENFINFYFKVPLIYLKQIIFHSNTVGIYLMQPEFRNHQILNILRYLSLLLHVSLFAFILVNFFTSRENWLFFTLYFILPVLFILYFIYFVQTIEQRYYSPVLPVLIIGAIYSLDKIFKKKMLILNRV